MTDIRPIFHADVTEKPGSVVIVHMLRMTERDNFQEQKDTYYALDSNDIRNLRNLIERALKKEEVLKNLMKESGITVIAPKRFF